MKASFLRLWTGPLPDQELFPSDRQVNPLLHWFIHPVKRRMAKYYLLILQKLFGLKVIAITGSSGKTTTAGMLYSVLSRSGPAVKTADSVTSTYNIPTTILRCSPKTRFLILEMGVEYPGDMDFYCWLAKPDIATVLNVSSVHSSFLGTLDRIRAEKYKLQKYSKIFIPSEKYPLVSSVKITSELKTQIKILLNRKSLIVNLHLLGTHFSQNVAAVIRICRQLGIPDSLTKLGLESAPPPSHRMNVIKLGKSGLILDDTYNANPLSVSGSLNTLSQISKLKSLSPIFIFGQMNELGRYEKPAHEQIGRQVKKLGIKKFYCLGPATKYAIKAAGYGRYFKDLESLSSTISPLPTTGYCLLIKGSHSWHLEKLVNTLSH